MSRIIKKKLFILIFVVGGFTYGQKISVKSFELLANDLEARINPVIFDGDVCALLKLETATKNLVFEGGSLGIAKVVQKKGEVWVYVPYGARFLTIKHEQLGVLRNYEYPTGKLQKATTYAMQLTTAKITTIVEEKLPQFGLIKSNPDGADVYIDGMRVGTTPTKSFTLLEGTHTLKISKHLYEDLQTTLNVTVENKFSKSYTLTPEFGTIKIESKPQSGASITIDGVLQEETTPATISFLAEGNHTIKIGKDFFDISEQNFSITKQEAKSLTLTMKPIYEVLSVEANPNATIYIDNQEKGIGSWSGRVLQGVHLISIRKDKYITENITHTAIISNKKSYKFELKPKLGTLKLTSVPEGATVFIHDKKKGETPIYIRNLLIGEYNVTLEKEGFTATQKKIYIKQNQTISNNSILEKAKKNIKYSEYYYLADNTPSFLRSLRSAPNVMSGVIHKFPSGSKVYVIEKTNSSYWKVAINGTIGFISKLLLNGVKPKQQDLVKKKVVTKNQSSYAEYYFLSKKSLSIVRNLRRKPNVMSDIIYKIPDNPKVYIIEKTNNTYWKVEVNGVRGYISKALLNRG
jgi:uncharacterized protein YgiM (DUF1202 family)